MQDHNLSRDDSGLAIGKVPVTDKGVELGKGALWQLQGNGVGIRFGRHNINSV